MAGVGQIVTELKAEPGEKRLTGGPSVAMILCGYGCPIASGTELPPRRSPGRGSRLRQAPSYRARF
jgi:hypothetical protein